jgi:hypothetical protein
MPDLGTTRKALFQSFVVEKAQKQERFSALAMACSTVQARLTMSMFAIDSIPETLALSVTDQPALSFPALQFVGQAKLRMFP